MKSGNINDYFTNIGHSLVTNSNKSGFETDSFTTDIKNSVFQSIVVKHPLPLEIYNIFKSLHPNKASGNDDISGFFLHLSGEVLAPVLSLYFSAAIILGVFPQTFKTAEVIPMLKSGSKQILPNYRPISLGYSLFCSLVMFYFVMLLQ